MNNSQDSALENYPHGRGYGHDYMRGGEVLGGYGYSERDDYAKRRGELDVADGRGSPDTSEESDSVDGRS